MPETNAGLQEAVRGVLAENSAAAPNVDTDTLAALITTAVENTARDQAAANADPVAELAGDDNGDKADKGSKRKASADKSA